MVISQSVALSHPLNDAPHQAVLRRENVLPAFKANLHIHLNLPKNYIGVKGHEYGSAQRPIPHRETLHFLDHQPTLIITILEV
jgi:hypothetical protein